MSTVTLQTEHAIVGRFVQLIVFFSFETKPQKAFCRIGLRLRWCFGVVRELADATTLCLTFKTPEAEERYARRSDPCPLAVAAPPLMLLPAVVALASFAVPPAWSLHAVYLALILETGLINVVYYACFRYAQFKVCVYR